MQECFPILILMEMLKLGEKYETTNLVLADLICMKNNEKRKLVQTIEEVQK